MMTNSNFLLSQHDRVMATAASDLLEKLLSSGQLSPAQRVSIAKFQLALSLLPRSTEDLDLVIEITGPRCNYGEVETYHHWTLTVLFGVVAVSGGGHIYRHSTGGDSFTTFRWEIYPGQRSEYADNVESLSIVPDIAPFNDMVKKMDFTQAHYKVGVTDAHNHYLIDDDHDDEFGPQNDDVHEFQDEAEDGDYPEPEPLQIDLVDEIEIELASTVDIARANRMPPQFAYGVEVCDFCNRSVENLGLIVDGEVRGGGGWANMCAKCFGLKGVGIGWGKGQLYAKQPGGAWRLVQGFESK